MRLANVSHQFTSTALQKMVLKPLEIKVLENRKGCENRAALGIDVREVLNFANICLLKSEITSRKLINFYLNYYLLKDLFSYP